MFLLESGVDYEGYEVVGLFYTTSEARAAAEEIIAETGKCMDSLSIVAIEPGRRLTDEELYGESRPREYVWTREKSTV